MKAQIFYNASELENAASGMEVLLSEETDEENRDFKGNTHRFYMTRVVLRRPA
jgi:hypothetical protein